MSQDQDNLVKIGKGATSLSKDLEKLSDRRSDALPVPELPTRMLIDFQGGYCNLKCPKCYVHGNDNPELMKKLRGRMSLENAKMILDEVCSAKPLVQPNLWTEPLMGKEFREHMIAVKAQGMPVGLNTNGLLLDEEMAQFLVDLKFDSVSISVDAMTKESLLKTRGTDRLEEIQASVFRLLRVRGDNQYPRVGVSFTVEDANRHERDDFVNYWIQHVDVVRIGEVYETNGSVKGFAEESKRVPCGHLYHTMAVHFNGNVSMCCLDGYQKSIMGNIFSDGGVKAVWHNEKFSEARRLHETGQYDKLPFCKNCDVWASHTYIDSVEGDLLVRRAPLMTYYNRLDRANNWNLKHNAETRKWEIVKPGQSPVEETTTEESSARAE